MQRVFSSIQFSLSVFLFSENKKKEVPKETEKNSHIV